MDDFEFDDLMNIGIGAYHNDEECQCGEDEHPTDQLIKELEQIDREEVE